jgi:DNA-binding response OmpR family regulator
MAHVLVVDDDPLIREMLRFVLEDAGHYVTEAGDGELAIEALAADVPDAMVLDLMMPRVDGFGVLQARQETGVGRDTRTVILSCCSRENDFRRCWELGADEYLTKPVDVDRLVRAVDDLLSASSEELQQRRSHGLAQAVTDDRLEASASRHFLRS